MESVSMNKVLSPRSYHDMFASPIICSHISVPAEIGFAIEKIRDYDSGLITDTATGQTAPTGLPTSNMLFYELAGGCKAIVRPSGTEPKVKLYLLAQGTDAASCDAALQTVKSALMKLVK